LYQFVIVNICELGGFIYSPIFEGIKFTCTAVDLVPGITYVDFTFPHLLGSIDKYVVEIYDASFLLLGSIIKYPSTPVTGTFNNLMPNTTYHIKVKPYAEGYFKSDCAFDSFATLTSPSCTAPSDLSAALS
jgi:hypothetical protein